MKIKIGKMFAQSALTGMMCLGMGMAMAAGGMKHSAADFNGDGMVTEDELVTYVRMHFMTMDKNNDHMVDTREWDNGWVLSGSFLDQ